MIGCLAVPRPLYEVRIRTFAGCTWLRQSRSPGIVHRDGTTTPPRSRAASTSSWRCNESGLSANDVMRRANGTALQEKADLLMELGITPDPDRLISAPDFPPIGQGSDDDGRFGAGRLRVIQGRTSDAYRPTQGAHLLLAVCAVGVARPQRSRSPNCSNTRVQAFRSKVTFPSRTLLIVMRWALGAVRMDRDQLRTSLIMYGVYPAARKIRENSAALRPRQGRRPEPSHEVSGLRSILDRTAADELAGGWIPAAAHSASH